MDRIKYISILLFLFCCSTFSQAQEVKSFMQMEILSPSNSGPITGCDQDVKTDELFQEQIQRPLMRRVEIMNDYVSFMADKSKSQETRYYYRKKALPLFIGKGYEYEENGVTKRGVMMQTTSVNRPGVVTNTLLRDYFSRLVNLRYSKVNITSTEIAGMKVSDLKKVDSSDN